MEFRVLGGDGGVAVGFQTTSFLINGSVLFDAGSVATALEPEEQKKVDYIFLSHCHLDHLKDLCFLADNVFAFRKTPIQILGKKHTLQAVQDHIMNDKIWPDFSKLHNGTCNIIEFIEVTDPLTVDGLKVELIDVNHPVPAVGFIVTEGDKSIMITGDTGPTLEIWERSNKLSNLKAIFTEIAFPDAHEVVAKAAGHFTPSMFMDEMSKIKTQAPIYIYHLKPSFYNALRKEIDALGVPNLKYVDLGAKYTF